MSEIILEEYYLNMLIDSKNCNVEIHHLIYSVQNTYFLKPKKNDEVIITNNANTDTVIH
jgi:hypothetical protein